MSMSMDTVSKNNVREITLRKWLICEINSVSLHPLLVQILYDVCPLATRAIYNFSILRPS